MSLTIYCLNGPNLNLLGEREPEVYGSAHLEDYVSVARAAAERAGLDLEDYQTNHEGALVDAIHGARGRCAGILIFSKYRAVTVNPQPVSWLNSSGPRNLSLQIPNRPDSKLHATRLSSP